MSDRLIKVDKTVQHHAKALQRTLRGISWDITHPAAIRPTSVLGCSRVGTSVVYKTRSELPLLSTLKRETHDFWGDLHPVEDKHWNSHALDATDASADDRNFVTRYFCSWTDHSRWFDNNNQNSLCAPYLRAMFPGTVFVYVNRSPGDITHALIGGWGNWKDGRHRNRIAYVLGQIVPVTLKMGYSAL